MKTVVLEVRSLKETLGDATRVMKTGRAEREARIGFASPELLWQVLTAKRWELLKAMCWCRSDVDPRGGAACWSRRKGCARRRESIA